MACYKSTEELDIEKEIETLKDLTFEQLQDLEKEEQILLDKTFSEIQLKEKSRLDELTDLEIYYGERT